MSTETEVAARAVQEVLPALTEFVEATGVTGPVRELAGWVTDLIRYRRAAHQAQLLMAAADKVRSTGLPPQAVSDKLLRAVMEHGALEDDETMQDRWANLLANASTHPTLGSRAAFAEVLRQLEPQDAQLFDRIVRVAAPRAGGYSLDYAAEHLRKSDAGPEGVDNLERLGLIRYQADPRLTWNDLAEFERTLRSTLTLTAFGRMFHEACQAPRSSADASTTGDETG